METRRSSGPWAFELGRAAGALLARGVRTAEVRGTEGRHVTQRAGEGEAAEDAPKGVEKPSACMSTSSVVFGCLRLLSGTLFLFFAATDRAGPNL